MIFKQLIKYFADVAANELDKKNVHLAALKPCSNMVLRENREFDDGSLWGS